MTNRTVTEKLGDVISVKDFGASGDGVTDDTAIIQALFDLLSDANVPQPTNNNYTVVFPSGVYKISSIVVGRRTNLRFEGGRLEPLDTTTPRTHLIKFYGGYNKVYNLCVNMNYATNYDTVIWCRTRYLDFIAPEIWSAKCVWTFW
ncbi:glycosyl hydrolase family 28-related protein [Escherichia coli]